MHGGFALTVWRGRSLEVSLVIWKFDVIIFCYYGMKIQCHYRYYQLYKFVPHVFEFWSLGRRCLPCTCATFSVANEFTKKFNLSWVYPDRSVFQCRAHFLSSNRKWELRSCEQLWQMNLSSSSAVRPPPAQRSVKLAKFAPCLACWNHRAPPPPSSTISRYFHSIRLSLWNHSSR